MKSYWVNGILGVWLVILAYLGLPSAAENIMLIISGLIIAFISFRQLVHHKIAMNIKTEELNKTPDSNVESTSETKNKIF